GGQTEAKPNRTNDFAFSRKIYIAPRHGDIPGWCFWGFGIRLKTPVYQGFLAMTSPKSISVNSPKTA
ncbi:hypothetical protein, partial [Pseudoflavonifractor sp. 60]|uniref:hypothetical protein n=1 Tax=Pseudoflavonifractor sp. 60 TaxID=2304576 RepID=UPI001A9BAD0F